MSPHLAFTRHCEILVWICAVCRELSREKEREGFMVKGAYLSNWSSGIKCSRWQRCRVDMLLLRWAPTHRPPTPFVLLTPSTPSYSVNHGSRIQRWRVSEPNRICEHCYAGSCMLIISAVESNSSLICLFPLIWVRKCELQTAKPFN